MACIVGVAGGTGAGKSTIVRRLLDRLDGAVMDVDSYYLDQCDLPSEQRSRLNYDTPDAIDAPLLVKHLRRLAGGEPVGKPVYSFATHTRVGVQPVAPADLLVVEGLFTWWWEPVRALLTLKVFVDAAADLRLTRRLQRDVAERGRSVAEVLEQYRSTVRPAHQRYVEPTRALADLVVVNDGTVEAAVDQVLAALARAGVHANGCKASKVEPSWSRQ
jgi:uridine kinase